MENADKTLVELKKNLADLKEIILCQEMGNDFYYSSPLYAAHCSKLYRLNEEIAKLTGKSATAL